MSEEYQICPYTGLRSFTEEESLYFKGREEDINQATEQLQKNKFLMLTGASGDGKSSLIFAGIIPNARAGFLRSKYTNWCVADFRPERSPFQNLCKTIARQLGIANSYSVQSELNHGFSAIVDLYKNSKRYIDTNSTTWQLADNAAKTVLKREAANLIILVDQFEEFFTNPENYHNGVPSTDASLVLNLLLETARISLEEDLPIYVVFTMRSDYIGQCAAFRGLPECIGFSQFFVPRLNRTQLQQVIEEPAELSGNRITRRLTERLIHDLTEGVDQLPILQHALNQIWHAAENGRQEMDLVHYAMVGGMSVNELPDEHLETFNKWFESLPNEIKACYVEPNLQNVLDTHTNKLYERAAEYYLQQTGKSITDNDAKAIIRTSFICLTKIDQSRAVRNRMTLKEIVNIIGKPEFGITEVGVILNIFREPGNTFIRPFISDQPDSHILAESAVLDITHESLIRNWEYLEQWAKQEFDNYTISLDFEQQLNRWVQSGKSNGFLLSIGQLTYFENWFNTAKPNAYWIGRYLPEETKEDKKLARAKEVLDNSKEFLRRSAGKHVITRTIMRYGPRRIAAFLAIIALIVLSSFAVRNFFHRQNDYVLNVLKENSFEIANKPKLSLEFPVPILTQELIQGDVTIPEVINAIRDSAQKARIVIGIATQLINQGKHEPKKEILQSLTIADSLLEQLSITRNSRELSQRLKLIHDYSITVAFASFLNQTDLLQTLDTRNAKRSALWSLQIFKQQPQGFSDVQNLSLALENGINHKIFSAEELDQLLQILSPFENKTRSRWIEENYQQDKVLVRGGNNYGIPFNGLYQDLAYLYAAAGKGEKVLQCMDTLLLYQAGFHQSDYATHVENAANIAAVFYTYGTDHLLDQFVQGYCSRKKIDAVEFYNRLVSRAMFQPFEAGFTNFYAGGGGQNFFNPNLHFSSDKMMTFFFNKLKEEVSKIRDASERNLNMAVILKNEGIFHDLRKEIRGTDGIKTDQLYETAINYYDQVPKEYLNENISIVGTSASDLISMPRKFLFLFPDYRVPFHPFEPRSIFQFYYSSGFIRYLLDQRLIDSVYEINDDFKYFELWLLDYQVVMSTRDFFMQKPMPVVLMDRLASKLEERKANQSADLNILYLHLGEQSFKQNEAEKGIAYLKKIQPDKLLNAFQYKNFSFVNDYSFELVGKAIAGLFANNQFDLAYSLLNVFKKPVNRSSLYAYASQLLSLSRKFPGAAQRLLDSARAEMTRLDNPAIFQPNRHQVAMALMYMDPEKNSGEAYRIIKNSPDKLQAISRFCKAYAFHGALYEAQQQISSLVSTADRADLITKIVEGFNLVKPQKSEWKEFEENELIFTRRYLPYINENE